MFTFKRASLLHAAQDELSISLRTVCLGADAGLSDIGLHETRVGPVLTGDKMCMRFDHVAICFDPFLSSP